MPSLAKRSMFGVGMPPPFTSAIRPEIAIACVVRYYEKDVWLLILRGCRSSNRERSQHTDGKQQSALSSKYPHSLNLGNDWSQFVRVEVTTRG
jgi:hypothetical protein